MTQALHDTRAQKGHELETARESFRNDLADIEQRYCDKRNQDAKVSDSFYTIKIQVDRSFRHLFATKNVYFVVIEYNICTVNPIALLRPLPLDL